MTTPDPQAVRTLIDELVDSWPRTAPSISMRIREHHAISVVVHGMTAHCHHLARAIRVLDDAGLHLACAPLVRQLIECSITAAWVETFGMRAVDALAGEQALNRKNALDDYVKHVGDVDEESRRLTQQYVDNLERTQKNVGRRFYERCEDLEGAMQAYTMWRIISADSHSSTAVADRYVLPADGPAGVGFLVEPSVGTHDAWLGVALRMLLLAAMADDRFDVERRRRTRLRGIARELEASGRLLPTAIGLKRDSAYRRLAKEGRAHRAARAARAGAASPDAGSHLGGTRS
jgi:hypothetical protein